MRIHPTPARLRPPAIPYPSHHTGPNIEQAFTDYATEHAEEIDTHWIYLPIHWQTLYFINERASKTRDYFHDPEAQELVNRLDPQETYFTVSQADEGTYEKLPKNIIVFNAGGTGHYPIPLLTSPLTRTECKRDILASFLGSMNAGGPIDWPLGRAEHSSWNPDGRGATVRRKMFKVLSGRPRCVLKDQQYATAHRYVEDYAAILCRSIFALAPRGYGKTSFRMYEAMALGAIPVYIYDEPWIPFTEMLDWTEFSILCHVSKLETLEKRLLNMDITGRQQRLGEVVPAYFTMTSAAKRIGELVERHSRRAR